MWIPSSWRFLLSSLTWLAPVTLATRADVAGEPPLKVLRDLGQPRAEVRNRQRLTLLVKANVNCNPHTTPACTITGGNGCRCRERALVKTPQTRLLHKASEWVSIASAGRIGLLTLF